VREYGYESSIRKLLGLISNKRREERVKSERADFRIRKNMKILKFKEIDKGNTVTVIESSLH
jgi:hypothetical protein